MMRQLFAVFALCFSLLPSVGCRALGLAPTVCDSAGNCPFGLTCSADGLCVEASTNESDGGERVDSGVLVDAGNGPESPPPFDGGIDGGLDAGALDAGALDGGDAGPTDSGMHDAGVRDGGPADAGEDDAGSMVDAGPDQTDGGLDDYIAAWAMDEAGLDATGTFNGTYSGDVFFAPGLRGQAAYFRDQSAAFVVGTPLSESLSGQEQATFSAWVRDDKALGYNVLFQAGHPDFFPDFAGGCNTDFLFFDVGVADDQFVEAANYSALAPPGRWHHWAAVFDGTRPPEERSALYIDGIPVDLVGAHDDVPPAIGNLDTEPFSISSPSFSHWEGFVDEARLYTRALSPSEIASLATAYAPTGPDDFRFFAPFERDFRNVAVPDGDPTEQGSVSSNAGVVGENLRLDGPGGYMVYPALSWLNGGQTEISVSLWFTFNDDTPRERQFMALYANNGRQVVLGIDAQDAFFFDVSTDQGNVAFLNGFSSVAPAQTWHHLAVTLDGARPPNERVQIFLNGAPLTLSLTGQIPDTIPDLSNIPLLLGASDSVFDGAMDEVMIFDRALTSAEISALVAAGQAALGN